jgi:hypothetical protein
VCRIVPHSRRSCTRRCIASKTPPRPVPADAALQWHAYRFISLRVCPHTKDVDLLILIGYNLSIRTGFEKRSKH